MTTYTGYKENVRNIKQEKGKATQTVFFIRTEQVGQ